MTQYQQSKSGIWHVPEPMVNGGGNAATCRYQRNLDKPIKLHGPIVNKLPPGATLCKGCAKHGPPDSPGRLRSPPVQVSKKEDLGDDGLPGHVASLPGDRCFYT